MYRPNAIKYQAGFAVVFFVWLLWHLDLHQQVAEKARQLARPHDTSHDGMSGSEVFLPDKAAEYCSHYRLEPADSNMVQKRKIYDLLLINTEVEMLEVRIGQMAPYVDYFVILESDKTFTDHPKPLYIRDNWELFKPWHKKMILRTMDLEKLKEGSTWDREHTSRNAMYEQVIPSLVDEQAASIDDILIVSDVDEIPKPEILRALRNCNVPVRNTIHSSFYYYSYQWRMPIDWPHPQATLYRGADTILPSDLRGNAGGHEFDYAGWHCSYCFSTVEEMAEKINSFSHSEFNRDEFKDINHIINVTRNGLDIFKRADTVFRRFERNFDVPDYIKQHSNKFRYLIDRDPPNGNFKDYNPISA
ncbi:glycosyl transferase family 17 protein [Colletotrichum tofieldiae]|uniref:Glycosyl transferase family 17 protein n=1 Tax=Colletotrichum tofieldiae TaxID=708197 RepID=A0A161W595_9PEZI|nr:glycosyl transferase family 17 protein [Colletotrichum tofieldiae]GKT82318.1 glycosyl transferase family 17 protein [Colletotrichum tofieldiae]